MSRYIDAEKLKCSIDSETDSIFDWDMTIEELTRLAALADNAPCQFVAIGAVVAHPASKTFLYFVYRHSSSILT